MPQYRLDDKYTEGVWYDQMNGDFCEIQESADGELVELVNPETGDVYWDMPVRKWVETDRQDFRRVPQVAVEDPAEVVRGALRMVGRNDINEMGGLSMEEAIKVRYAREQVSIESQ
jgi:hypothetical protein